MHVDWRPRLLFVTPDIRLMYAEMRRRQWEIVYALDEGGVYMDFFIAADSDGNQIMVGNRPFGWHSTSGQSEPHPVLPEIKYTTLSVKDEPAARMAYSEILGETASCGVLRFANKFHRKAADSPIQLETEDMDLAYQVLRTSGMSFLHYPGELDDGSYGMIVSDPDGNPLTIRSKY